MSTALLLMDFQNGIAGRPGFEPAIESASRALAAARGAGMPVVFIRVAFRDGYPEVSPNNMAFSQITGSAGDSMHADSPATQVVDALAPEAGEQVVVKKRFSAFAGNDLEMLLRARWIDHLVLGGVSTSGVVLSTVRQAGDLDFGLTVLSDACADSDQEVHRILLDQVFPRQATVTTVDEWVETLG